MMLRQFEHLIGYTTTSKEFVEAVGKQVAIRCSF